MRFIDLRVGLPGILGLRVRGFRNQGAVLVCLGGSGRGGGGGDSRGLGFKGFRGNALEVFWRFRA